MQLRPYLVILFPPVAPTVARTPHRTLCEPKLYAAFKSCSEKFTQFFLHIWNIYTFAYRRIVCILFSFVLLKWPNGVADTSQVLRSSQMSCSIRLRKCLKTERKNGLIHEVQLAVVTMKPEKLDNVFLILIACKETCNRGVKR